MKILIAPLVLAGLLCFSTSGECWKKHDEIAEQRKKFIVSELCGNRLGSFARPHVDSAGTKFSYYEIPREMAQKLKIFSTDSAGKKCCDMSARIDEKKDLVLEFDGNRYGSYTNEDRLEIRLSNPGRLGELAKTGSTQSDNLGGCAARGEIKNIFLQEDFVARFMSEPKKRERNWFEKMFDFEQSGSIKEELKGEDFSVCFENFDQSGLYIVIVKKDLRVGGNLVGTVEAKMQFKKINPTALSKLKDEQTLELEALNQMIAKLEQEAKEFADSDSVGAHLACRFCVYDANNSRKKLHEQMEKEYVPTARFENLTNVFDQILGSDILVEILQSFLAKHGIDTDGVMACLGCL